MPASSPDPHERGLLRGSALRDELAAGVDTYLRLFRSAGIEESRVRDLASRSADAVTRWRPARRAEMDGIASGAGVEPWHVYSLNARTEVLATSSRALPGECSTIAHRRGVGESAETYSIQTWDWHVELDRFWHTYEVRGGRHDVVGLTEHGMLGKIGMNSAGLGTHFNILGHRTDTAGGVPVHVLAATVLEEAGSVAEAVDIARSAPVSASSALTLLDRSSIASLEITGSGCWSVEPTDGTAVRTNHFLSTEARRDERTALYQPDSGDRFDLIRARLAEYPEPQGPRDLPAFLYSGPGEPALCNLPDMSKPLGERWGTLATVVMEPRSRTAWVAEDTPIHARMGGWRELAA